MHTGTARSSVVDVHPQKLVSKGTVRSGTFPVVARDLTPEENESARLYLRELLKQHDHNQSAVARLLGMRVPSGISRFLAGNQGTSRSTCLRIAELLNVTVEEVLGHAPRSGNLPAAPDRYPARARALARLRGILPPEVEKEVRDVFVDEANPPTEREWVEYAVLKLKEHDAAATLIARVTGPSVRKSQ